MRYDGSIQADHEYDLDTFGNQTSGQTLLDLQQKSTVTHTEDDEVHAHPPEEGEVWLMSFADLVSNLLMFFIVMYAISDVSEDKLQFLAEKINGQRVKNKAVIVQAETESENEEIIQQLIKLSEKLNPTITEAKKEQKKSAEEIKSKLSDAMQVVPGKDPENDLFELVLGGPRYFEKNASTLTPEGQKALDMLAARLKNLKGEYAIVVEGHAAPEELSTQDTALRAWTLAAERAAKVMLGLREREVMASQMSTAGFGAEVVPPALESQLEKQALPRARVHIRVVREIREGPK